MTAMMTFSGNPVRPSVTKMVRWGARARRAAATLGLLAAVNFPEMPKAPKPPEPEAISLYVWNASQAPAEIAVAVDGTWLFREPVPAGQGASRDDVVEVLAGDHRIDVLIAGTPQTATVPMEPSGNRWLVVTWWGEDVEITMQQQPPWVDESDM